MPDYVRPSDLEPLFVWALMLSQSLTGNGGTCGRLHYHAVERRRFPVGASPTRQPLQPEATGAVMAPIASIVDMTSSQRGPSI